MSNVLSSDASLPRDASSENPWKAQGASEPSQGIPVSIMSLVRWVFFVPIAVVAGFVVGPIVGTMGMEYAFGPSQEWPAFLHYVRHFYAGVGMSLVIGTAGVFLAPSHRYPISFLFAGISGTLAVIMGIGCINSADWRMVTFCVGAFLAAPSAIACVQNTPKDTW
jgi:hypothetical protein